MVARAVRHLRRRARSCGHDTRAPARVCAPRRTARGRAAPARRRVESGEPFRLPIHGIVRPDGTERLLEVRGHALCLAPTQLRRGSFRCLPDITERRASEAGLARQRGALPAGVRAPPSADVGLRPPSDSLMTPSSARSVLPRPGARGRAGSTPSTSSQPGPALARHQLWSSRDRARPTSRFRPLVRRP